MCNCETSFGSIFLFEIGASVDGAPVVLKCGAKLKQAKESKLTLHAVVIFRLKQTKQRNTE